MLFRRITQHVREQNWTAIAIDFVIVVTGVFLGLQVQEWSSDRAERARVAAQLASFRAELILAREDIAAHKDYIEDRLAAAREVRAILADPQRDVPDAEIYALSRSAIRAAALTVDIRRGYEELSQSGSISSIRDPDLKQILYTWDSRLSRMRMAEARSAEQRDILTIPPILGAMSAGNIYVTDGRGVGIAPADRFPLDLPALRRDRDFDNALAIREIQATQNLRLLIGFEEATNELIDALENEDSQ
uniref:hypothetical protein n=1 Tax=uncultured Erythrobacter sp. TaxID=263913 RepID=UPI00261B634D|nr:hypothetical protein [uncultured Erythrobacter sp.]